MIRKITGILLCAALAAGILSGCSVTPQAPSAASEAQTQAQEAEDNLAAIEKAGKIKVGIEGTYYPFTYHDETGELAGYDIEVAKFVAEKLGVECEFIESDWDSLLAGLDSGRLDTVINDVTATDERREKYDFSEPYFFSSRQIVVKTGDTRFSSLEDLNGAKCATNLTNSYAPTFEKLGVEIVPIDNTDQAASLVETGRADFCTFNNIVLGEYLEQHPDAQLEVAFQIPDSEQQICVPVRKGETRLLEKINEALDELRSDGTLSEMAIAHFGSDYSISRENNY